MASVVRPTLVRQACLAAASKRALSSQVSTLPSAISRPAGSVLSRPAVRSAFVKDNLGSARIAAFHSSEKRAILPPGPQIIDGTANDAAVVPPTSPANGSYHWTFERLVAVGLIPLTVAPFAAGSINPLLDATLCGLILIHSHIGFEAVVIDYIPNKRLPKTRSFFGWGLRATTVLVGVGLYEFETNDVGLTEAIKRIWTA
ncbi:MAG: membrane anchor subunit of succinate dehydrogenase, Sdh4 [Claussenomyces sp. TS43310]|nr:MAG: membrane anchor subunit of succinate dehydrogenase, Sdh4 [Claussenomyces sp. TS43310]